MTAPPSAPVSAVAGEMFFFSFLFSRSRSFAFPSSLSLFTQKKTSTALTSILRNEGVLALWRGAAPRAVWVAPLGAMNFAGYELAKRALERGSGNASGSGSGSGGESETNDGDSENANDEERLKKE